MGKKGTQGSWLIPDPDEVLKAGCSIIDKQKKPLKVSLKETLWKSHRCQ
jgi:hypothetical protein